MNSEFKPIIVSEEELQKRINVPFLKDCKLFKKYVRTEANKQIMINRLGEVRGAKPSKNDVNPGLFHDKANDYIYIRLYDGGMIALHIAMKFVFYDEIFSPFDSIDPTFVVDHINGKKQDNRLDNLRIVSKQFNSHNHPNVKGNVINLPSNAQLTENNETKLKCYLDDDHYYIELRSDLYFKTKSNVKLPKWICKN